MLLIYYLTIFGSEDKIGNHIIITVQENKVKRTLVLTLSATYEISVFRSFISSLGQ